MATVAQLFAERRFDEINLGSLSPEELKKLHQYVAVRRTICNVGIAIKQPEFLNGNMSRGTLAEIGLTYDGYKTTLQNISEFKRTTNTIIIVFVVLGIMDIIFDSASAWWCIIPLILISLMIGLGYGLHSADIFTEGAVSEGRTEKGWLENYHELLKFEGELLKFEEKVL